MVGGKHGHAPCKTSRSKNPQSHGSQPRILECASLACSMTGGLMSALGCGLGRGI